MAEQERDTSRLGFVRTREVQAQADARFAFRSPKPLEPDGNGTLRVGDLLTKAVVEFLRKSRTALAAVRKLVRNAGKRAIDRIVKATRTKDLVDTRLFISAWRAELVDVTGQGLALDLAVTNTAPYALYVHPKRTRRSRTFINTDLPPIMREIGKQIKDDIGKEIGRLMAAAAKPKGKR